eukprot:TRINITY_DN1134_c1_g2_i1.p1 TRINITY_DN1134_c1_g2~~TRINITY_DN1134_c1_g2_i1.p1  ORF type:complete len:374 (+),score=100.36 TRINITY_DN1134_c1_g2_i1:111-1124(+)
MVAPGGENGGSLAVDAAAMSATDLASAMPLDSDALLEAAEGDDDSGPVSFRDLLGPNCVIKRMDKNKNIISEAAPEEMQAEMMTRASAQKRLGACAEHVKSMSQKDKLAWGIDLKEKANAFYAASTFDEAAKLYNDCLVAIDLSGTEEENREVVSKLQLPVCTNLAACMIEMGHYQRCIEICDIALSADEGNPKAAYRRGLARYRLGNHAAARPDFERALRGVNSRLEDGAAPVDEEERKSLIDVKRRVIIYLNNMRRHSQNEKQACQKMFEADKSLYADRPGAVREDEVEPPIDDSDAALDAALQRVRDTYACCRCGRRARPAPAAPVPAAKNKDD